MFARPWGSCSVASWSACCWDGFSRGWGGLVGRRIVWFSCGSASAVAAKLAEDAEAVYCDTMATEHPDNERFFADVERWIGRPIRRIRSERYATVDEVFEKRRYMAGVAGAICTTEMKKLPREGFADPDDVHIFGFTSDERQRAEEFEERNPALKVDHLLVRMGITKARCHELVAAAGIEPPAMYALGFDHNNCIGCVKATSPGYWNRTREHFPEVFERRCRQSRLIGARLVRIAGERRFLDELPPEADAPDDDIECGPGCQMALPWDLTATPTDPPSRDTPKEGM